MKKGMLLLGLILICTPVFAQKLDNDSQKAYNTLKTVPHFAIGGVGFAAQTSEGENALRLLLKQKEATTVFQKLLKEANREGQLYALLGLKLTNSTLFAREAKPFSEMKTKVHTMSGCIFFDQPVTSLVTTIKKGDYDKLVKKEKESRVKPGTETTGNQ